MSDKSNVVSIEYQRKKKAAQEDRRKSEESIKRKAKELGW